ncbi:NUDIX domain-containing protein [Ditylenchus destructor]|uniref:Bis(5'-nucleosyl)-tetraphosphatase [asymmetrical] n=1 Tax=Ditylenchus destructor TaxID=166010 RepID=A0AAD4R0H9_9BILA|nr:NUDIX domain-containing protein [Ditylenchus destructor]
MASEIVRAAGLLIYRRTGSVNEYLLLQASYEPHHWTPPKGHVDPGEDEWTAALREVKEEASIDSSNLDIHKDFSHVMNYEVNGKPKKVTYWLAHLKSDEAVKPVQLSKEHQNSSWCNVSDAITKAKFPEMGKMLKAADEYLKNKYP